MEEEKWIDVNPVFASQNICPANCKFNLHNIYSL